MCNNRCGRGDLEPIFDSLVEWLGNDDHRPQLTSQVVARDTYQRPEGPAGQLNGNVHLGIERASWLAINEKLLRKSKEARSNGRIVGRTAPAPTTTPDPIPRSSENGRASDIDI